LKFLVTLFSTILIVCGKVNFSNLSRCSSLNEKTYRRQFEQAFDFIGLNLSLVEAATAPGQAWLGVMDSSFIRKSGKTTFGLDWYYNGSASRAEQGLEVSLIGMVNVATEQSYAVSVEQTCNQSDFPELSRIDQALDQVKRLQPQLPATVRCFAVDGADAKEMFLCNAAFAWLTCTISVSPNVLDLSCCFRLTSTFARRRW
jgi:hypothetical protein